MHKASPHMSDALKWKSWNAELADFPSASIFYPQITPLILIFLRGFYWFYTFNLYLNGFIAFLKTFSFLMSSCLGQVNGIAELLFGGNFFKGLTAEVVKEKCHLLTWFQSTSHLVFLCDHTFECSSVTLFQKEITRFTPSDIPLLFLHHPSVCHIFNVSPPTPLFGTRWTRIL